MHFFSRICTYLLAAITVASVLFSQHAVAEITWSWSYTGNNIDAVGTFITAGVKDADGFYEITGITGTRNGEPITALFPAGSAIPGNEPFAVDNLIRIGAQGQLSGDGFGFTTATGNHANPFFADFLPTPGYLEVFSTAAGLTELPVSFSATIVSEPNLYTLLLAGIGTLVVASVRRRRPEFFSRGFFSGEFSRPGFFSAGFSRLR
ncbi:MAG: PEP-CTERM sorting domain-containing protein [Betaproteobacteria bacterium]